MIPKTFNYFINFTQTSTIIYRAILPILIFGFLFGAMIIVFYLLQIEYASILTFEALSSLIVLSSPVGLITVIFPFLLLFYPSYLYRQLLKSQMIFTLLIKNKTIFSSNVIRDDDFTPLNRLMVMGSYVISMVIGINIFLLIFTYFPVYIMKILCICSIVGCLIGPMLYHPTKYLIITKNAKQSSLKKINTNALELLKILLILGGAVMPLFLSLDIIRNQQIKGFFEAHTLLQIQIPIGFFSLLSSFYLIPLRGLQYNLKSILLVSLVIFSILIPTLDFNKYCGDVIKYLKIGNMHNPSLILNKEACSILLLGGYPIKCDNTYNIINDIDVLWRVGEYYLKYTKMTKDNGNINKYFIIPSTDASISFQNTSKNQQIH